MVFFRETPGFFCCGHWFVSQPRDHDHQELHFYRTVTPLKMPKMIGFYLSILVALLSKSKRETHQFDTTGRGVLVIVKYIRDNNNNNHNHISRTTSSGPKADPKLLQWECLGQRKSRHVLESSKTLWSILVVGNNVGSPIININLPFGDGMYIYVYIYMCVCVSSMHL